MAREAASVNAVLRLVPVLLGDRARLFANLDGSAVPPEPVRAVPAPGVTHLRDWLAGLVPAPGVTHLRDWLAGLVPAPGVTHLRDRVVGLGR